MNYHEIEGLSMFIRAKESENESPNFKFFHPEPSSSHHIMTIYSFRGHGMKPWFCSKGLKVQCKMASDVKVHTLFTV